MRFMRGRLTQVFCFLALSLFIASVARAEYRVYQLGVTYGPADKEVVLVSTLDNYQYVTYYQLSPQQSTRLIDHWICLGDTSDFKAYCPNPKTLNPSAAPSVPAQTQTSSMAPAL